MRWIIARKATIALLLSIHGYVLVASSAEPAGDLIRRLGATEKSALVCARQCYDTIGRLKCLHNCLGKEFEEEAVQESKLKQKYRASKMVEIGDGVAQKTVQDAIQDETSPGRQKVTDSKKVAMSSPLDDAPPISF